MSLLTGRQKASVNLEKDEANIQTKSQIDIEIARLRSMTPQEAAAVAARAVEEAEAAIAEAEEAAREAEAAEAEAEAAEAFAQAAMKTMKERNTPKMVKLSFSFILLTSIGHVERFFCMQHRMSFVFAYTSDNVNLILFAFII